jgi:dipeptidyl aminopeptidase/acylaminoacyl peptidase
MRRKPITVDDVWAFERIGSITASPDGTQVACSVTRWSMDDNKAATRLWLLSTLGGEARALTTCGDKDGQPRWSPDGQQIAFLARRGQGDDADKTAQVYLIAPDGGEARRVCTYAPGISTFRWMSDSRRLLCIAWVWPDARGAAAQNKRQRAFDERKESGYATSEGQYRYWDSNLPMGRVPHLLLLDTRNGRITDLFEGTRHELPRFEPGLAHIDVSPDGRRIAFAHDPEPVKAGSNRLVLTELDLRTKRFRRLADQAGWDYSAPRYGPDGTQIAAVAAEVGRRHTAFGQLSIWPVKRSWRPADARTWTHDVGSDLAWSADGGSICFTAEEHGRCHVWRHDVAGGDFEVSARGGSVQAFALAGPPDAEMVVTLADGASHPAQVSVHFNDALLAKLDLGRVEEHWILGALGERVQLWLVHPPAGVTAKARGKRGQQPVLHVIHGGPYTASGDSFSYRWNAHLLASRGHVVVELNYHGSSGFGEDFRASIMGRQGQLEMQDLQAAVDWVGAQPWADANRTYAAGASYGGYLVAWLNGHWKPWPRGPIRAYVCHAGVYDRIATWSADSYTQRPRDLGARYWEDRAKVEAQSPHAFAHAMDTPTLVTHGAQDYRVPDHNGLAYFNTLKARGVDARLLWFPDENHWVLKARNSKQWVGEVFAWLERHGGPAAAL